MSLNDKVVLVTGASSGIGAAIAIKFASEGAKVAIVGRNEKKLSNVANRLQAVGSTPLVINADVAKDDDAKRIVSETIGHFSKLDVLVNNAGIGNIATIVQENTMDVYDQVMGTNLRAPVHLIHLASPHLIESKGNVINVSSIASKCVISDNNLAYGASKAALDHCTKYIAFELAPKGVRVNTINPGYVRTDILEKIVQNEDFENLIWKSMMNSSPMHRLCETDEIADLALFLASDKAKGITGASYVIDSGALLLGGKRPPLES
ncbi:unnamed protein product [Diatraea saccharalis]|uniref:Uncharacterized protein n=1 Tax=Diatraea saccharalis TaxID=40085 RepID=A0A9N9WFF3_9NEOP|nr:unnamed protein product [Diatraea saccharalis]